MLGWELIESLFYITKLSVSALETNRNLDFELL